MYKSIVKGKGGIEAKVVADSIANGVRITTMELRYHRFIHGEFLTHRLFSRNSSSSRAIPVIKMIEQVQKDPAMPIHWGKNQAGMQANEECDVKFHGGMVPGTERTKEERWKQCSEMTTIECTKWEQAGYHKQIVNRLLEPFQFIKTVVTATEWDNFFKLRDHKDAQPEIQELAKCMKQAMNESVPDELEIGEWHTPYVIGNDNLNFVMSKWLNKQSMLEAKIKCSVSRCARVSYQKHDNTNPSIEDDLELYNQLAVRPFVDKRGNVYGKNDPVHLSPLEHIATPMKYKKIDWGLPVRFFKENEGISHVDREGNLWSGNFKSWVQYRKLVETK